MALNLSIQELVEYTDWERGKWWAWFRQNGEAALQISGGPHGDGRFATVGDSIRHIFGAEKRFADRLSGREIVDPSGVPTGDSEALFTYGQQSRTDFLEFMAAFPVEEWDVIKEFPFMGSVLVASTRKIVCHVLLHEIRHWAQVATILRLQGMKDEPHDLLFSPVMGGEFRRGPK